MSWRTVRSQVKAPRLAALVAVVVAAGAGAGHLIVDAPRALPPIAPAAMPGPPAANATWRTLYEGTHDFSQQTFGNARNDVVPVRAGTTGLRFEVGYGAASGRLFLGSGARVGLLDPTERLVLDCRTGPCSTMVASPRPGLWRVAYSGSDATAATTRLSITGAAEPPPARVVLVDATVPGEPLGRAQTERQGFVVEPGAGRLRVDVTPQGTIPAVDVTLTDPSGTTVLTCQGPACTYTTSAPAAGLWLLDHSALAEGATKILVSTGL
ncbi:MAG: hypothetical protein QOE90_1166 [Thermoplasmata archaeon]|jgi:hypothetical protein|nr:hypothetical protein [Thermoplasmata archaeon]